MYLLINCQWVMSEVEEREKKTTMMMEESVYISKERKRDGKLGKIRGSYLVSTCQVIRSWAVEDVPSPYFGSNKDSQVTRKRN